MQICLRRSRAAGEIGILSKVADPARHAFGPNPARKTNPATEKKSSTGCRKIICAQRIGLPAREPAQFVRFAVGDPELALIPTQTLEDCLQELWRSIIKRCRCR